MKFRPRIRSRNGFTQNASNVWGHCEQPSWFSGRPHDYFNRTLYRCDLCKQFVCASHHKEHVAADHALDRRPA